MLWKRAHAVLALLFTGTLLTAALGIGTASPFWRTLTEVSSRLEGTLLPVGSAWPSGPAGLALLLMYFDFLLLFSLLLRIYGKELLTAANALTSLRIVGTAPLLLLPWELESSWIPVTAVMAVLALSDAADGILAKRYGSSGSGALLDEEADAQLTLIIAYLLYARAGSGLWVPVAGTLRYCFVLLYTPLELGSKDMSPPGFPRAFTRFSKTACAASVALLIGGFLLLLPPAMRKLLPPTAFILLAVSFIWEAVLRLRSVFILPPHGFLRSWLIYYGIPGKRRRMKRLYADYLGPGSLAFDLGSHLGNRIPVWRSLEAEVVALEPNPACFQYLERRFGTMQGVTLLPLAAGRGSGEAELRIDPRNPTLASISRDWIEEMAGTRAFRGIEWSEHITVKVVGLEELFRKYGEPDFCKIDVEGFEKEVLEGLERPLRALSFEYLPQASGMAERCLDLLESLGRYEYYISSRETMRYTESQPIGHGKVRTFLRGLKDGDAAGDIYGRLIRER